MTLFEQWVSSSYYKNGQTIEKHWNDYMPKEQKIYENILENKIDNISGTVKKIGERFNISSMYVCGFIDGINEILPEEIDVESLEEDTEVTIKIDFEKLYKKMVEYKAEHLYSLEQWKNIFTEEQMKNFYVEQKHSTTFVRTEEKVGRNEPCPCGSGKKYKKCCGA